MSKLKPTTHILGDEYNSELRERLMNVLRVLGASSKRPSERPSERTLAGSQELEKFEVVVKGKTLLIEAETYVGLSITGPKDIVDEVQILCAETNTAAAPGTLQQESASSIRGFPA